MGAGKKCENCSPKEACRALYNLPRKLQVLLALNVLTLIMTAALLAQAFKAKGFEFPAGEVATPGDRENAKRFQSETLKWSGGPGFPLLVCVLFGLYGSARRNRLAIMTYIVLGALCFVLTAVGFARPVHEGALLSFRDACSCSKQHCCNLGDKCTGNWHASAYCTDGGSNATCPAGQFANATGSCHNCTLGSYKATNGPGCCTLCAENKMTFDVAATSPGDCSACAGSCPAGQHGASSGSCKPCPSGFECDGSRRARKLLFASGPKGKGECVKAY